MNIVKFQIPQSLILNIYTLDQQSKQWQILWRQDINKKKDYYKWIFTKVLKFSCSFIAKFIVYLLSNLSYKRCKFPFNTFFSLMLYSKKESTDYK